ncbi:hypothetical protein LEMLEM_LOCUS20982 [Lemmus lemmus]
MSAAYKEDWKLLLEEQVPGVEMCLSQPPPRSPRDGDKKFASCLGLLSAERLAGSGPGVFGLRFPLVSVPENTQLRHSAGLMNRSGGQMPAEKIQPDSAHRVKGRKGFVCSAAGWCQLRTQSRGRVHSLRAAAIASLSPSTKAVSPNTQSSGSNHASG